MNWIRDFGKEVRVLNSDGQPIEMAEADEMHSYIGQKKTAAGYGLLLIDTGKDLSASLLATEAMGRQKSFGKK